MSEPKRHIFSRFHRRFGRAIAATRWQIFFGFEPAFGTVQPTLALARIGYNDITARLQEIMDKRSGQTLKVRTAAYDAYDAMIEAGLRSRKHHHHGTIDFGNVGCCRLCWRLAPSLGGTGYKYREAKNVFYGKVDTSIDEKAWYFQTEHLCTQHSATLARAAFVHDKLSPRNLEQIFDTITQRVDRQRRAAERIMAESIEIRKTIDLDDPALLIALSAFQFSKKRPWEDFILHFFPRVAHQYSDVLESPRTTLSTLDDDSFPRHRAVWHDKILGNANRTIISLGAMLVTCESMLRAQQGRKIGGARAGAGRPARK